MEFEILEQLRLASFCRASTGTSSWSCSAHRPEGKGSGIPESNLDPWSRTAGWEDRFEVMIGSREGNDRRGRMGETDWWLELGSPSSKHPWENLSNQARILRVGRPLDRPVESAIGILYLLNR